MDFESFSPATQDPFGSIESPKADQPWAVDWVPVLASLRSASASRGLSPETTCIYLRWAARFSEHVACAISDEARLVTASKAFFANLNDSGKLSRATIHLAQCALAFLFREVLGMSPPRLHRPGNSNHKRHIPVVFSRGEVIQVLNCFPERHRLIALLTYGCGLRVSEAVALRVHDVDVNCGAVVVRKGKGAASAF